MINNQTELRAILDRIVLPFPQDASPYIKTFRSGDGFLIQIIFWADDPVKLTCAQQFCRKWYISRYSTETEVVRTIHKAGIAAIEHEFNEGFLFDGVAIANPHLSCKGLAEADIPHDVREPKK